MFGIAIKHRVPSLMHFLVGILNHGGNEKKNNRKRRFYTIKIRPSHCFLFQLAEFVMSLRTSCNISSDVVLIEYIHIFLLIYFFGFIYFVNSQVPCKLCF